MNEIELQGELKSRLEYNPLTGKFIYIRDIHGGVKKGTEAGYVSYSRPGQPYRVIYINGVRYGANRLAILYMTGKYPSGVVDHIDQNTLNNSYDNLRDVSKLVNSHNRSMQRNNSSGVNGVYWSTRDGKYRVQITIDSKTKSIGMYSTLFEAACARKAADRKYGFHENHGSDRSVK